MKCTRTSSSSRCIKMEKLNLDEFLNVGGAAFLKAKDVKGKSVKAVVIDVRSADLKMSGKTVILDIEVKKVKWSFPLNVTNLKKMIELHKADNTKWAGKEITLFKVLVNNPKEKKEVESLRIK